jgi:hypothetical protein
MNPNKLQLDKQEYYKCESCGGFHPADEVEVAIIRVIKGKNCELRNPIAPAISFSTTPDVKTQQNSSIITNEDSHAPSKPKKAIIPPGILGMMLEPGHPQFESHGAKETRKI